MEDTIFFIVSLSLLISIVLIILMILLAILLGAMVLTENHKERKHKISHITQEGDEEA